MPRILMQCFRLFILRLSKELENRTLLSYSYGYKHSRSLCSVFIKWIYGVVPHLFS